MRKFVFLSGLFCLSVMSPTLAAPEGGDVRAGSATIQQSSGTTTVRQLTDRAIIDWQRFGVARDELVRFLQPAQSAVLLNRVVGGDPSVILGQLRANGQIFLVNPNGVLSAPARRLTWAGFWPPRSRSPTRTF